MQPARGDNFQQIPLNLCGSSVFGRYPKISQERTYNMFQSDGWLVDYAGYSIVVPSTLLSRGIEGRGIFTSTKFNRMVVVIDNLVYLINIVWDQETQAPLFTEISPIGTLSSISGVVYITENNKPQILISDNNNLYIYDPQISGTILPVPLLDFRPGYITFHDDFFIAAASQDTGSGLGIQNNTWRLSLKSQGYLNPTDGSTAWPYISQNVGVLTSKPDNVQAVVRFPSKGNMIFVMGSVVTEAWFDTGAQLFPYQRNNQFNIDYGCISPATVAYMDEIVVWLAQNEKSGPIVMYSNGGMPQKITTDGIDYLFAQLQNPQNSQGFLYRQDGHLFYHLNFYSDNISLFFDFLPNGEIKIYDACDQRMNYFIAAEVAFFGNQYYFVSRNSGNLYAFDTIFTNYQDVESASQTMINTYIIPRIRICKNIRLPTQDYFIANDFGFTIESGETNYYQQFTSSSGDLFSLLNGQPFVLLNGQNFLLTSDSESFLQSTPVVYMSLSYDGGASFGNRWAYQLPAIGQRRNRLMWWQGGITNDCVAMFEFEGMGRFLSTDGYCNIRI